jgi:hypothetical protein
VREWRAATDDEFAGRARPRVARRAAAFFADPLRTIEWEAATLSSGVEHMRARGLAAVWKSTSELGPAETFVNSTPSSRRGAPEI